MQGLSKLRPEPKGEPMGKPKIEPAGHTDGEMGEKQTVITHHADGTHTSKHEDGAEEQHPDHLHMLASVGHHVTGGDKHHVVHHDGMQAHSHSVGADGQHGETQEHNSAEEAKSALGNFLDEEAEEPEHQHGEEEAEGEPAYGGMHA